MPTKFYHAENCNRVISHGGRAFPFKPYRRFGGTWQGTYFTNDEAEQAGLDALTANRKTAVTEITGDQWKAKTGSVRPDLLENYNPPLPPAENSAPLPTVTSPVGGGERLVASNAVVVETAGPENQKNPAEGSPVESVEAALTVGDVAPPAPTTLTPPAVEPSKKEQARAKAAADKKAKADNDKA